MCSWSLRPGPFHLAGALAVLRRMPRCTGPVERAWLGRDACGWWHMGPISRLGWTEGSQFVVVYGSLLQRFPQQMLPPTLTPGLGENSRSQVSLDLALSLRWIIAHLCPAPSWEPPGLLALSRVPWRSPCYLPIPPFTCGVGPPGPPPLPLRSVIIPISLPDDDTPLSLRAELTSPRFLRLSIN